MHEFSKKIISSFLLVLILYPFSVVANANEMGYTFIHWPSDTTLDVSMDDGLAFKELSAAEVTQSITAGDALAVMYFSVGLPVYSYQESDNAEMFQFLSADVNGDGKVNLIDSLDLLLRAAKVDSFEPEWRFVEIHQDSDSAAYAGYVLGDVDGSWTSFLDYSAGNGSQETDNHIINELDEFSPTITSSNSVSVNVSGVSGGVIYAATSNDSQSMLERGAISQQFVENEDGTLTVRLFVDSSVVQNYPNGLEAVNFTLGYSSEEQGVLAVESIYFPSEPYIVIDNDQDAEISFAMIFSGLEFVAGSTSGYADNLYDAAGAVPIAEVTFSVGNDSVVNQFTVFDTALTEHNGGTSLPGGQSVFEYQMTDTESSVVYSLTADSDQALVIDSLTGEVTLNENPDYDSQSEYNFTVVATDAAGNQSEQTVVLEINKVFDPPQFTSPLVIDIAENIGSDQVIYSAQADSYIEGGVVYSLLENDQQQGAIKQTFIDNNDGTHTMQLAIEDSVAEENNNSISCMDFDLEFNPNEVEDINADDLNFVGASISNLAVNDSYSDQIMLGVLFGDFFGGNQPLDISNERVFLEINFSLNAGISSAQFDVTELILCGDHDYAPSSTTFSPYSNSPVVINPNTGEVTLFDNPMYEAQSEYTFTVVATDAAGSTSQTVTVNVLDIEGNPLIVSSDSVSIDENIGMNQVIYSATSNLASTTFSLGADSDELISIDPVTGEVYLLENPDYENTASYEFTVIPELMGVDGIHKTINVFVTNLDDTAPTIISGDTAQAIDENSGADQVIYTATANDANDISAGVAFSLTADSDQALVIDSLTGEVRLNEDPDYDSQSEYNFTVVATDTAGNQSAQTVVLEINKVFDPPQFTSPLVIDIAENIGSDQVIYSAQADSYIEGGVVYSLLENNQQQGAIKQTFMDNNDGTHTMGLAIEDSVAEENNNSISCMDFDLEFNPNEVEDINADDLNFVGASISGLVVNDSYSDQIMLGVLFGNPRRAQPLDISNERVFLEINFSLNAGISSAQFDVTELILCGDHDYAPSSATFGPSSSSPVVINPNTGEVTLLDNPMYEAQSEYTFTVVATDAAGSTSQTVTVNVVRNLLDIDENGVADALTDGLTIMKYAFGIRNDAIFGESIAADSTLIYSQIESKLNLNSLVFDIDGDGHLSPLSDGLLILRYLFGLRDDALISGVVSEFAERNSYDEIINYLDTLKN